MFLLPSVDGSGRSSFGSNNSVKPSAPPPSSSGSGGSNRSSGSSNSYKPSAPPLSSGQSLNQSLLLEPLSPFLSLDILPILLILNHQDQMGPIDLQEATTPTRLPLHPCLQVSLPTRASFLDFYLLLLILLPSF